MSQSIESREVPSIDQRLKEARAVAEQFGCPVVINVPGENGTASIPIGKTPELTALTPTQQHVIFPPGGGTRVFPAEVPKALVNNGKPAEPVRTQEPKVEKPRKRKKAHDLTGFTGFWRGTFYQDGIAQNGKNGRGKHRKR